MLRRFVLPLLAAATLASGCADDDYGRTIVSTDMSANVADGGTTSDLGTSDLNTSDLAATDMSTSGGGG